MKYLRFAVLLFFYSEIQCFAFSVNDDDNHQLVTVAEIVIEGNDITKKHIILRELLFSKNQKIEKSSIEKYIRLSKENLLNTSLFNYVDISFSYLNKESIEVVVVLEERWYTWPYPVFEHADRNFSSFLHDQDWSRINYGVYLVRHNFRGRNENLKIKARVGYKEQYLVSYSNPGIDYKQRHGVDISLSYFRQHEIGYKTQNNILQYIKLDDEYIRNSIACYLMYIYRGKLYNKHSLTLGYNNVNISDTVSSLNPDYFLNCASSLDYFSVSYKFQRDKRDSKVYPLKGYLLELGISKKGIVENSVSVLNTTGNIGYYSSLMDRLYYSGNFEYKKSNNKKQPYYLLSGLGYDNYIRGFEYYVIDGCDYGFLQTSLKYELLPVKISQLKFIPFKKFNKIHYAIYAGLYFDGGYVGDNSNDPSNTMVNDFLYSGGVGLDFVTYYDKIFRIEYSINKFGERGIFLHFGAAF